MSFHLSLDNPQPVVICIFTTLLQCESRKVLESLNLSWWLVNKGQHSSTTSLLEPARMPRPCTARLVCFGRDAIPNTVRDESPTIRAILPRELHISGEGQQIAGRIKVHFPGHLLLIQL